MTPPDYLACIVDSMTHDHLLTGSRLATAQKVAAAIACNIPVLLEGPAAGKKATAAAPCHY